MTSFFHCESWNLLCDFHIKLCTSLSHVLRGCTRWVTAMADSTEVPGWVEWLGNLAHFTCFTPWGSEVGCRGMNVRNAQECRWAPWRQFKAMRGARAIVWVMSPWPEPLPQVRLLSADFIIGNGLPCFFQRNLFYTWDGTSSSLWFIRVNIVLSVYICYGTLREYFLRIKIFGVDTY